MLHPFAMATPYPLQIKATDPIHTHFGWDAALALSMVISRPRVPEPKVPVASSGEKTSIAWRISMRAVFISRP